LIKAMPCGLIFWVASGEKSRTDFNVVSLLMPNML